MGRTLVLLWLGTAAARAEKAPDIGSWAEARHFVPVAPSQIAAAESAYRAEVVERVESLLLDARTALDTGDDAGADAKLTAARRALLEDPVPQAAWLIAELDRLDAERVGPRDPETAAQLMRTAEQLGGRRAASYREPVSEVTTESLPDRSVELDGLRPGDDVYVNGVLSAERRLAVGTHHVRILHRDTVVFSGWVLVEPGRASVSVAAPPPCSERDLEGTRFIGDEVRPPANVSCPKWAVARAARLGIEIALCERARCGAPLPWRRGQDGASRGVAPPAREETSFPAWLGWTLAGVATTTATSLVLWQTGAFDAPEPGTTRFVFTAPPRP